MNYLVQRGKVRGQMIKVPDGLPELLSDITREVLRCQPTEECLIQFVMDYLQSVLEAREKALVVQAVIDRSLHVVDEIIGDLCICNIEREKAEDLAIVMEECFRNFLQKRRCLRGKDKEMFKFGEEDMLDELIARCKFSVEELQKSMPFIENAYQRFVDAYMKASDKAGGSEALYQYFKERDDKRLLENKRTQAAITIQKNWRGYLVRRVLDIRKRMKQCEEWRRAQDDERENAILDHAARIIQRFFRNLLKKCSHTPLYMEEIEEEELCTPKSEISLDPFSKPERGTTKKKPSFADRVESKELLIDEALAEESIAEQAVTETEVPEEPINAEFTEIEAAPEVEQEVEPEQQPDPDEIQPELPTEAEAGAEAEVLPEPEPEQEPEPIAAPVEESTPVALEEPTVAVDEPTAEETIPEVAEENAAEEAVVEEAVPE